MFNLPIKLIAKAFENGVALMSWFIMAPYKQRLFVSLCCKYIRSASDPDHVCFNCFSNNIKNPPNVLLLGCHLQKERHAPFNGRGEHHEVNRFLRKFWFSDGLDVQLARVAWRCVSLLLTHKISTIRLVLPCMLVVFWGVEPLKETKRHGGKLGFSDICCPGIVCILDVQPPF